MPLASGTEAGALCLMNSKSIRIAMAFSIFALAVAIAYAGYQLARATNLVAIYATEIRESKQDVYSVLPVLAEHSTQWQTLTEQMLLTAEQYREYLPVLDKRIAEINGLTADILEELPKILELTDEINQTAYVLKGEAEHWRPISVSALEEVQASRESVPVYLARIEQQMKQVQSMTTEVLEEARAYRESIPVFLDRIDQQVSGARSIASDAGSGVVGGLFKGAIALPFDLVKGVSSLLVPDSVSAKNLTSTDVELIRSTVAALLPNEAGNFQRWNNPESGHNGLIEIRSVNQANAAPCKLLRFTNYMNSEVESFDAEFCLNEKRAWVHKND